MRLGIQTDAQTFDDDLNIYAHAAAIRSNPNIACVLIDEAHFLSKEQVRQLVTLQIVVVFQF